MVIAIDGPAGAGKSTVAKALAERIGFTYLDSGAMYRCVALEALRAGVSPNDATASSAVASAIDLRLSPSETMIGSEDVSQAIRTPEVSQAASEIAVHPGVRREMVARQREIVSTGEWVAEGRDIGTVVSPDSPLKVYLTATAEERARRRAAESGGDPALILREQSARDARDSERSHGALTRAEGAVELDTTGLDVAGVVELIAELARERGLA